tara:strand:- start:5386 stop:5667 length:282 start_codon:yes stop_codon:yes gene_type:complete
MGESCDCSVWVVLVFESCISKTSALGGHFLITIKQNNFDLMRRIVVVWMLQWLKQYTLVSKEKVHHHRTQSLHVRTFTHANNPRKKIESELFE